MHLDHACVDISTKKIIRANQRWTKRITVNVLCIKAYFYSDDKRLRSASVTTLKYSFLSWVKTGHKSIVRFRFCPQNQSPEITGESSYNSDFPRKWRLSTPSRSRTEFCGSHRFLIGRQRLYSTWSPALLQGKQGRPGISRSLFRSFRSEQIWVNKDRSLPGRKPRSPQGSYA